MQAPSLEHLGQPQSSYGILAHIFHSLWDHYLPVRELKDFHIAGTNFCTDSISQIGILSKTTNQNDSFDLSFCGLDLAGHQIEHFLHHRIKNGLDFSTSHSHLVFADAQFFVVLQTRNYVLLAVS